MMDVHTHKFLAEKTQKLTQILAVEFDSNWLNNEVQVTDSWLLIPRTSNLTRIYLIDFKNHLTGRIVYGRLCSFEVDMYYKY